MDRLTITYRKGDIPVINEEAFDGKLISSNVGQNKATYDFDTLTEIRPKAFASGNPDDSSFYPTKVELPDSLKKIYYDSFEPVHCFEGKMVTPEKIIVIDGEAQLFFAEGYDLEIKVPEGVTSIAPHAKGYCSIKKLILPKTLRHIGAYAFCRGLDLTSVKMQKGLETIGAHSFESTELATVTIPDTVTSVGEYAFAGCDKLKKIKFGKAVETIGDGVVSGCRKMSSIEGKFATADKRALIVGDSFLAYHSKEDCEEYAIPEGVKRIGAMAFNGSGAIKTLILPSSLERIEESGLKGCIDKFVGKFATADNTCVVADGVLISVSDERSNDVDRTFRIPPEVIEIGDYALGANRRFTAIEWHNGVKRIGSHAFHGSWINFDPNLPSGLEEIGDKAFYDLHYSKFRDGVIIPASIKRIGKNNIFPQYMWFEPTEPPQWKYYKYEFYQQGPLKAMYVPAESVEAYKRAYPYYANVIVPWEK